MEFNQKIREILLEEGEPFIDHVRGKVLENLRGLQGSEDLLPVVFIKAGRKISVVVIDPEFMADEKTKDKLGYGLLPTIVLKLNADEFAFVSSVWMVKGDKTDENFDRSIQPRNHPKRIEAAIVVFGDAESVKMSTVEITRRDGKVMTGGWETSPADAELEGRMLSPLIRAIQFNRNPDRELGARIIAEGLFFSFNAGLSDGDDGDSKPFPVTPPESGVATVIGF